jgi:uncharacterized protein YoxC
MSKFFQIIIALAFLIVAAFVGFGIVTALNNVTQPIANTNNSVATAMTVILRRSRGDFYESVSAVRDGAIHY